MSDLHLVPNDVFIIKRAFGPTMTAPELVSALVRDLALTRALPLRIDFIEGWWCISSEVDWLAERDGSVAYRNFKGVVHFPEAGREACHTEVYLTAFADAVVTRGTDAKLTWITGDPDRWTLPEEIVKKLTRDGHGRAVAFTQANNP
jgi:hypothetical protein